MSRLIARILLSLAVWPLGALVYMMAFVLAVQWRRNYGEYDDRTAFLLAGAVGWSFVGVYWLLLWRGSVQWTVQRRGLTFGAVIAAAVVAIIVGGAMGGTIDRTFGWFMGSITAPVLWLVMTIFVWRESAAERGARISKSGGDGVVCPTCGYNLTGLSEARCPECGTQFTLNQLLAAQRPQTLEG